MSPVAKHREQVVAAREPRRSVCVALVLAVLFSALGLATTMPASPTTYTVVPASQNAQLLATDVPPSTAPAPGTPNYDKKEVDRATVWLNYLWTVDLPQQYGSATEPGTGEDSLPPLSAQSGCTGSLIDTDGNPATKTDTKRLILSAGHCGDPRPAKEYLQALYKAYQERDAARRSKEASQPPTDPSASPKGGPTLIFDEPTPPLPAEMPEPTLLVKAVSSSLNDDPSDPTDDPPLRTPVPVVQRLDWTPESGDVSVLQIDLLNDDTVLPGLSVATSNLAPGTPTTAIGFAGQFLDIPERAVQTGLPLHQMVIDTLSPATLSLSYTDGTASGRQQIAIYPATSPGGPVFSQFSTAFAHGMSGGPIMSGNKVVSVVSASTDLQPLNLGANVDTVNTALSSFGVDSAAENAPVVPPPAQAATSSPSVELPGWVLPLGITIIVLLVILVVIGLIILRASSSEKRAKAAAARGASAGTADQIDEQGPHDRI